MDVFSIILGLGFTALGFAVVGIWLNSGGGISEDDIKQQKSELLRNAEDEAKKLIDEARKSAEDELEGAKENLELLEKQIRREEDSLCSQEKQVDKVVADNGELLNMLNVEEKEIDSIRTELSSVDKRVVEELLKRTGESFEEVKTRIIDDFDRSFEHEGEMMIKKTEEALNEDLEKRAKYVIGECIQKYAKESSVDKRYSVISIPKDHMKGRLIGDDAKNLLLLEERTEAQIIFNDAPNTIIVSHYNLLRQEITCLAIKKLLKEREVNEDMVVQKLEEAEKDVDKYLLKIGKEAAERLELGEYPDDFYILIGRLRYRTSFGQNILSHSFEVAAFGRMLAGEIGADIREAELACFFHDIGKAIDQDVNSPHDILSKEILEKYGFHENIVHAAHAHHDAVPSVRPVDFIVKAADAISAGRPGARQETLEKYLEKIRALESIASAEEGVEKVYAISAGREVRVFVDSKKVADEKVGGIAQTIAHNVEENVIYPGKIKINVIRRTKAIDFVNKTKKKSKS